MKLGKVSKAVLSAVLAYATGGLSLIAQITYEASKKTAEASTIKEIEDATKGFNKDVKTIPGFSTNYADGATYEELFSKTPKTKKGFVYVKSADGKKYDVVELVKANEVYNKPEEVLASKDKNALLKLVYYINKADMKSSGSPGHVAFSTLDNILNVASITDPVKGGLEIPKNLGRNIIDLAVSNGVIRRMTPAGSTPSDSDKIYISPNFASKIDKPYYVLEDVSGTYTPKWLGGDFEILSSSLSAGAKNIVPPKDILSLPAELAKGRKLDLLGTDLIFLDSNGETHKGTIADIDKYPTIILPGDRKKMTKLAKEEAKAAAS